MNMNFSKAELDFIEKHRLDIDARAFNKIVNAILQELGPFEGSRSSKKLAFTINYIFNGPQGFRLRLENRGSSRSLSRANAGQKICRIHLDLLDDSLLDGYISITYMKGTLNPENLTWGLLHSPLRKTILRITGDNFMDVVSALADEWKNNGGKYD